jgi:hypothetical protein
MDTPTQAPYEIAKYLSDEAKRAAVARTYEATRERRPFDPYVSPRCASGMCPMGAAMLVIAGYVAPTPSAHQLAAALGDLSAWGAAEKFMCDWDAGEITDLAAALGVAP